MKFKIQTINEKFKNKRNSHLFLIFFLLIIFYKVFTAIIVGLFSGESFDHLSKFESSYELFVNFLIIVILAPLFETLIYQFITIELLVKLKLRPFLAMLVSVLVFALVHNYNLVYIVVIFPIGFIYSYYYYLQREKDRYLAFISVMALHAASNLLAYINNYFLVPFLE